MALRLFFIIISVAFHLVQRGKTTKTFVEGDIAIPTFSGRGPSDAFTTDKSKLWENGRVPFLFKELVYKDEDRGQMVSEPLFSDEHKKVIRDSLRHISLSVPCLKFR